MERETIIIPAITDKEPDHNNITTLTAMLAGLEKMYGKEFVKDNCAGISGKLKEETKMWGEYRLPRISMWKQLIGKYWKLTIVPPAGSEMVWWFVYPNQVRLDNETVFALLSGIGDLNGYKSGIQESSMGMFDFYHWCDLRFEESSREEMEANALASSVNVIEHRLKRQQENLAVGEVDAEGVVCTQMSMEKKKDFRKLYARMAMSEKFAKKHRTIGEIIPIEE